MKRTSFVTAGTPLRQRGAAAVEFALVSALFLMALLIGIVELGRAFFYMNASAEATRLGARIAVVCDKGATDAFIKAQMAQRVSVLTDGNITIAHSPANCSANTSPLCESVTVSITGATFDTVIPFVPLTWTLPAFATTLSRESLDSAGGANPVCR